MGEKKHTRFDVRIFVDEFGRTVYSDCCDGCELNPEYDEKTNSEKDEKIETLAKRVGGLVSDNNKKDERIVYLEDKLDKVTGDWHAASINLGVKSGKIEKMYKTLADEKRKMEALERINGRLHDSLDLKNKEVVKLLNRIRGLKEERDDLKTEFVKPNDAIEKVIFNDPATIIFWWDGTKTVVKAQYNEPFDPEKGFAMAFLKKVYANSGMHYMDAMRKWIYDGYAWNNVSDISKPFCSWRMVIPTEFEKLDTAAKLEARHEVEALFGDYPVYFESHPVNIRDFVNRNNIKFNKNGSIQSIHGLLFEIWLRRHGKSEK